MGSVIRLGAHACAAAAVPSTATPPLKRVWASALGPTVAIDGGWIAAEHLRQRIAVLEEELGTPVRVDSVGTELHLTLVVEDPLTATVGGTIPPCAPDDLTSILLGKTERGAWAFLPLKDRNGIVYGAEAGGGKTFTINVLLAGWAQHPAVQIAVIDGKGGADFLWLDSRAQTVLPTVDRQAALEVLTPYRDELNRRTLEFRRGFDNWRKAGALGAGPPTSFWHDPPDNDRPLLVVVVDEAQVFLSGAKSKEDKAAESEMTNVLADLYNRGRSSGLFTVVATQKPTTDSLPSIIRDKAAMRLVGRLSTAEAVRAALGRMPVDGEPDPQRLAQRPGMVIMAPEAGPLVTARSWMVSPADLARLGLATAHLRRSLPEVER
ncbi:FtsK/SpoIIIE domain-containing protein [Gordonia sp. ABSL49_1]|uniref:FtsK/SpoIIIE domain-containing protein n=1 Tax=Gordonia sp. ABSL49_1 TaxID=2920941 RepID=UPI001F0CE845|nr:FtsK/SpoIIIE domain-containing protein [Gordonia sp. ABSL49_1]MCH5644248.1 hypothetical protein [Gordonia sp. ABSL49_1]